MLFIKHFYKVQKLYKFINRKAKRQCDLICVNYHILFYELLTNNNI